MLLLSLYYYYILLLATMYYVAAVYIYYKGIYRPAGVGRFRCTNLADANRMMALIASDNRSLIKPISDKAS